VETVVQDLRFAIRTLLRQPGFTAIAVLTLTIGIGANTAIYSVVNATLLRPLPYRDPDGLMRVSLVTPAMHGRPPREDSVWSYPKYEAFRKLQNVFGESALYRDTNLSVTGAGDAGQMRGEFVEATYFPLLGIPAEAGRVFQPEEDSVPERDMVAMISHKLWVDRYGADPAAVGKTILFNLQPYRIVGVVPADFRPLTGMADVWLPIHTASARQLGSAQSHSFQMVARRKAGVSAQQAAAAVTAVGARIEEIHPDPVFKGWGAKARTLDDARADPAMRKAVLVLFVAVSFVLLIACVNIANLLLARGSARRREIAIRLAVGANRLRLVRQLLTESVVLSLLGSLGGLGIAYAGVKALSVINPVNGTAFGIRMSGLTVLGLTSIRLDLNALAFTLCVALATGMLFGLAPALQASRVNLTQPSQLSGVSD
jgi:predicted permease